LITPRRKKVISGELQLSLFFFMVSIAMVAGTYLFLSYKTYEFRSQHATLGKRIEKLDENTRALEHTIENIEVAVHAHDDIATNNIVMRDSIRNLFDLVPDKITLTRAELGAKSLVLSGITPSKETYEFLLQAPLRAIFHRSYTSYYPDQNGWYRFTSTNYLDDDTAVEVIE
jgi:hypothetical protein